MTPLPLDFHDGTFGAPRSGPALRPLDPSWWSTEKTLHIYARTVAKANRAAFGLEDEP